jgi:hypothetical protein
LGMSSSQLTSYFSEGLKPGLLWVKPALAGNPAVLPAGPSQAIARTFWLGVNQVPKPRRFGTGVVWWHLTLGLWVLHYLWWETICLYIGVTSIAGHINTTIEHCLVEVERSLTPR